MKLTPLKENYSSMSAKEIVRCIGLYEINGLWLRESHYKQAKDVYENITESEAEKLLLSFDEGRQSDYDLWRSFN